jgi:hypothetical protein
MKLGVILALLPRTVLLLVRLTSILLVLLVGLVFGVVHTWNSFRF